jgi:hypothetical protein
VDALDEEYISIPVSLHNGTVKTVNETSAVHDAFGEGVEDQAYPSAPNAERASIQSLASHHDCTAHNERHDNEI